MRKLIHLPFLASLLLALLGLSAPAVQAAPPAATLSDGATATITLIAPNAAIGQRVVVQWGDPLGNWHNIDGWSGPFQTITPQGEAFMRWTVFSGNFGQKPFRWVVYNPDGQSLWAVGPWFMLPVVAGQDVDQRLDRTEGVTGAAAPTPAAPGAGATPTPAGGERVLEGHTFTLSQPCFGGGCSGSEISALIGGLPSSTWIAVQWLDSAGLWQTVTGWQGNANSVDHNGVLFQHWHLGPELLGRGPFRWAVYPFQGGSLIGVSPSFNMPEVSNLNEYMSMALH